MPQLIKPGQVKVVTQDGEVHVQISLELTINLNTEGVNVTAQAKAEPPPTPVEEKTAWAIPDFGTQKLNFGKRE